MIDHISTDLAGAEYLSREDWDCGLGEVDLRDEMDYDYERAIDNQTPLTEAFYPEWTQEDSDDLNSLIVKITCGSRVDFLTEFDSEDIPF